MLIINMVQEASAQSTASASPGKKNTNSKE